MPDTTQTADFDTTIHFLQQDLASADLALAINYIEQWENQLQETDIFQNLMELKQSILDGNLTELEKILRRLGESTTATANDIRKDNSETIAAKVEQIGQLLIEASRHVK
jgi:hypothetical protein